MQDRTDAEKEPPRESEKSSPGAWETLRKHWVIVLLAIYAVVSLFYQASAPWLERTLGTGRAEYQVTSLQHPAEEYRLAVHYPTTIPLETAGERGRPLVVWLWGNPLTATTTTTATWRLIITATNDTRPGAPTNIIFTDKDGLEIASALDLQPGTSEPEAPRSIFYVSRLVDGWKKSESLLHFQVWRGTELFDVTSLNGRPLVKLETNCGNWLRKFADLIFNTKALTWTSIVALIWDFLKSEREKRQERIEKKQKEQILAIGSLAIPEAWTMYQDLWQNPTTSQDFRAELKNTWEDLERQHPVETSKAIRGWLTSCIKQNDRRWKDIDESQSTLSAEDIKTLTHFFVAEDN